MGKWNVPWGLHRNDIYTSPSKVYIYHCYTVVKKVAGKLNKSFPSALVVALGGKIVKIEVSTCPENTLLTFFGKIYRHSEDRKNIFFT